MTSISKNTPSDGPILIIEDNKNIASLIAKYLIREGFDSFIARDGPTRLARFKSHPPLLIVPDLMLPGIDGWEVCREIRKTSEVPILILSARVEEVDRILGFSIGADDYVVKPFSPREVVEQVKAILRRVRADSPREESSIQRGRISLDPEKHKVTVDHKPVLLTPSEYKLLHALINAPGRVFSRDELLAKLYGQEDAVVGRVIDVHIGKFRQKIEPDPSKPTYVLTVRGIGYRFAEVEKDQEGGE